MMQLGKQGTLTFMAKLIFVSLFLTVNIHHTHSGRIFEIASVPSKLMFTQAGQNFSLPCPGLTEHAFVLYLEWLCTGCGYSLSPSTSTKLIRFQEEATTLYQEEDRIRLQTSNYSLLLTPVLSKDSGEYSCLVNNRPNPAETIKLLVQDVPDPPGRPIVLGFSSRTVNLSWAAGDNHNSPITHYIIYTKIGEGDGWDYKNKTQTETNNTFYHVTSLIPYKVYSFRVVAVNGLGRSRPSISSYYIITLREAPVASPLVVSATNLSSSEIFIEWEPPDTDTINGQFQGYKISYTSKRTFVKKETILRDPDARNFTIRDLRPFTNYVISLQVFNPVGNGPPVKFNVCTDEGVPTKPIDLTLLQTKDTAVKLSWNSPVYPNGIIVGYNVYYRCQNKTHTETIRNLVSFMAYELKSLMPFTECEVWVKAFNSASEGDASEILRFKTDVTGPSAPYITKLFCVTDSSLLVEWTSPVTTFGMLDSFQIHVKPRLSHTYDKIHIKSSGEEYYGFVLQNMTEDVDYDIKICGVVNSVNSPGKKYIGQFSKLQTITFKKDCEVVPETLDKLVDSVAEYGAGIIAGIVFMTMALCLLLFILLFRRKPICNQSYTAVKPPVPEVTRWDSDVGNNGAIPAKMFSKHIEKLEAENGEGMTKEYLELRAESRAKDLVKTNEDNASFCVGKDRNLPKAAYGFKSKTKYYFALESSPKKSSAFWSNIWKDNITAIVSISNDESKQESSQLASFFRKKSDNCGKFQVTVSKETRLGSCVIRDIIISNRELKNTSNSERKLFYFHYKLWRDFDKSHQITFLSFVRKCASYGADSKCYLILNSQSVGGGLEFIVLDAILSQLNHQLRANVFGFIQYLTTTAIDCISSTDSLRFLYYTVLEEILVGNTEIQINNFPSYMEKLRESSEDVDCGILDQQFKMITDKSEKLVRADVSQRSCNVGKNRNISVIPNDDHRIKLTARYGDEGSDYINASWFEGYRSSKQFIVTQYPFKSTIGDFWQMIWETQAQIIVLLASCEGDNYPNFWIHEEDSMELGEFHLEVEEETPLGAYITREITVKSLLENASLSVFLVQQSNWPDLCQQQETGSELLSLVQRYSYRCNNVPTVVVDRFGGTSASSFCCLMSATEKAKYEHVVDIYYFAKLYSLKRTGIWKKKEHLSSLYQAMEQLLKSNTFLRMLPNTGNGTTKTNGHLKIECSVNESKNPCEDFALLA